MHENKRQYFVTPDRETSSYRTPLEHLQKRIPPQAVDIEAAVLGAMLLEKEAIAKAIEVLDDTNFYKPAHQSIFKAMTALFERNEPVDLITLSEELRRRGELEKVGGDYYLAELTSKVTSAANVEYHAHIVLEKALMRQLIATSTNVINRAYNETEDPLELLDDAERSIFTISEQRMKKSFTSIDSALHKTLELIETIHGRHGGVTGIPSGFIELDSLTGGFQPSDLIIIAGRPSQGKTAFALSIARNAAVIHNVPIGIFSLEMSTQQLVTRLICAEARVDAQKVRTGRLPEEEWQRLSMNVGRLYKAKIFIDDTPALNILEIRAKARRLKAEHNVGLIMIDYLQLIQGPKSQSREQEISAISRSLKALAKELNIPVIALSQLNRAVEARSDKRPTLADLRESGAIEQDADVVIFVHRPEAYGIEKVNDRSTEGLAEIIVGKQRNGPTDTVELQFIKQYVRFENRIRPFHEPLMPAEKSEEMPF
ncbi:MAG: replicative DNA helicase [Bacteroidetes bacterium]|nr:replicative DNA helicase [Bacteroidota bacterium]